MSFQPEFFGKYILLEKLATGGMAEVYLAKSTGAENVAKYFAIKRILPQFSQNQEFIEMFKEEAKIAVNLAHSNVVPIYEFGEQNGQFYLVMEYVEGRNLRQILNRLTKTNLRLSLDQIIYITNEVARGLDHAHRCVDGTTGRPLNITHRDMSPQNVMISFEGEVKVVDFGIAKAESKIENTRAGTLKGKFGYMSPEQAEGLEVDFRTDIFSLGIVLWELIAGERLFISNNEVNTLRKIRDCVIPSLRKIDPNIPAEIERITNKALARDRNLRYQSASEFHRDLSKFLNRQFPDFTTQDFSTFIKTIFEKERDESRQKMMEYGKIQSNTVSEKTQLLGEGTHTITQTNTREKTEPSKLQNLISDDKLKSVKDIDLDVKFKRQDLLRQQLNKTNTNIGEVSGLTYNATRSGTYGAPIGTNTSYTGSYRKESSSTFTWLFIFVLILAGAGYWLSENDPQLYNKIKTAVIGAQSSSTTSSSQSTTPAVDAKVPSDPPQPSKYKVLITSTPSDAQISIDGAKTDLTTPAEIEIAADKQVKLLLTRQGYANEEIDITATRDGQEFRYQLVKIKQAYITVTVRPETAGTIIYVNKQPITKGSKLARHAVKPDTPILIQAYDPTTGITDARTLQLKEDTELPVQLFMRKQPARGTSSSPRK